jgi:hypothetical protein
MRRGRQAADDGSFARSVGVHTARGALLIGIAVVLGIVLLQKVDSGKAPSTAVSAADSTTLPPTTAPPLTTTTRAPTQVKVLVANGTTTSGVALTAKNTIGQAGYNVLAPVDATAAAKATQANTRVFYAAGYDSEARKIAALLGLTPAPQPLPMPTTAVPVSDLKAANVLVVIGPDYIAAHRTGGTGATTPGATTTTTRRL